VPQPVVDENGNACTAGVPEVATATEVADRNDVPVPMVPGKVAGSVYFVPKPLAENGYPVTRGVVVCAKIMASPDGENLGAATTAPPAGNVAGSENLVP